MELEVQPKPTGAGLGERIQEARIRAGLYQRELAQAIGVRRDTVGHYEAGLGTPSPVRLGRIAKTLGVTIEHLLGDEVLT